MSDTLADLASWLPSEICTGEIDDHPPFLHNHRPAYDLASSSSTESESDDDDITGLTRRFTRSVSLQERLKTPFPVEKKRVFSGSPESTLNWNVSGPTQVRSSPATPLVQADVDAWDLIYAAAGQIARMKMNNVNDGGFVNRGLPGAPRPPGPPLFHHNNPNYPIRRSENEVLFRQQQFRQSVAGNANFYGGGRFVTARPVGFCQSAWPPVETHRRHQPADSFAPVLGRSSGGCGRGLAGGKKECAGTGVFLPRNYSNLPPEPKKKPVCSSMNLPTATRPQVNNINGVISPQCQVPPLPNHYLKIKHDEVAKMIMAHRQKVAETRIGEQEVVLPQEWTY